MIRLILLTLFFFLGYTVFWAVMRRLSGCRSRTQERRAGTEEMVQDPCCGIFLPRSDALEESIGGTRHFFCSEACRKRFRNR